MRSRSLIALAWVLTLAPTPGASAPPPDFPPQPDHLEPIDPNPEPWHVRYLDRIRKKLDVPEGPEAAVMISMPSFDPEECLVLRESEGKPPSFTAIHTRADRNI